MSRQGQFWGSNDLEDGRLLTRTVGLKESLWLWRSSPLLWFQWPRGAKAGVLKFLWRDSKRWRTSAPQLRPEGQKEMKFPPGLRYAKARLVPVLLIGLSVRTPWRFFFITIPRRTSYNQLQLQYFVNPVALQYIMCTISHTFTLVLLASHSIP